MLYHSGSQRLQLFAIPANLSVTMSPKMCTKVAVVVEDCDDLDPPSPAPPWQLMAGAKWASLSHRLLVRETIRRIWTRAGGLLEDLEHHRHPLSERDFASYIIEPFRPQ